MVALLRIMTILITNYCKIIKNYDKNLLQITAVSLQITTVSYYKLRRLYYRSRQKFITNYDKKLLQITAALIFEKFKNYYILRQVLLHITAVFSVITNYGKFLLQIAAGITHYDLITNYVVTYAVSRNAFFERFYSLLKSPKKHLIYWERVLHSKYPKFFYCVLLLTFLSFLFITTHALIV